METPRSCSGDTAYWRTQFRHRQLLLFSVRFHSFRVNRADPANAPESLWLYGDRRRACPRSRSDGDRSGTGHGQAATESRSEADDRGGLFHFRSEHVVLREFRSGFDKSVRVFCTAWLLCGRRISPRARAIWPDLGSTRFVPGIPRLLLSAGMRLPDRRAFGFLHAQVQVGWSWRRTLTPEG